MPDILPAPTDEIPEYNPGVIPQGKRSNPQNRLTVAVLVGLVVIAVLALVAGYIYDVASNNRDNNTRKQDIAYVSNTLNDYYGLYHYYPTLNQINSSTFSAFLPDLDHSKFKDPNSTSATLSSSPSVSSYAYEVGPDGCNNTSVKCTSYKLVATLSDGTKYVVSNDSSQNQPATIK